MAIIQKAEEWLSENRDKMGRCEKLSAWILPQICNERQKRAKAQKGANFAYGLKQRKDTYDSCLECEGLRMEINGHIEIARVKNKAEQA